jgi:hypothetical protein
MKPKPRLATAKAEGAGNAIVMRLPAPRGEGTGTPESQAARDAGAAPAGPDAAPQTGTGVRRSKACALSCCRTLHDQLSYSDHMFLARVSAAESVLRPGVRAAGKSRAPGRY